MDYRFVRSLLLCLLVHLPACVNATDAGPMPDATVAADRDSAAPDSAADTTSEATDAARGEPDDVGVTRDGAIEASDVASGGYCDVGDAHDVPEADASPGPVVVSPRDSLECPERIQRSIVVCVDALTADDDFDDTAFFLIDLVLACADPEPMAGVWDGLCAESPERAECVVGFERFVEEMLPLCVDSARDEVFAGRCAFPATWDELPGWPGLALERERSIDRAALSDEDDVLARQLALAASFGVQQAHSVDEAFALCDRGVFHSMTLIELGSMRRVHVLTSTFGENRYGRAFFEGTTFVVATIVDGDVMECAVESRPGRPGEGDQ